MSVLQRFFTIFLLACISSVAVAIAEVMPEEYIVKINSNYSPRHPAASETSLRDPRCNRGIVKVVKENVTILESMV